MFPMLLSLFHFEAKKVILLSEPFKWGDEKALLLQEIDAKDFFKFLENFKVFLKKVIDETKSQLETN